MSYIILNRDELPRDGSTFEFVGLDHDDTEISFIWVDMPPGEGVRLHQHPYKEMFIIQEGTAAFTVGATILEAHAGQIIIAPADVPHKFVNTGDTPLRQIDIHFAKEFDTRWLE